jgi:hypothetical protein
MIETNEMHILQNVLEENKICIDTLHSFNIRNPLSPRESLAGKSITKYSEDYISDHH